MERSIGVRRSCSGGERIESVESIMGRLDTKLEMTTGTTPEKLNRSILPPGPPDNPSHPAAAGLTTTQPGTL
jgi:hypothetical protein